MKKKIIVLFTSLLLMIPVITVPVHAEDVPLYWDGVFFAYDNYAVYEDSLQCYAHPFRVLFSYAPTHHLIWYRLDYDRTSYSAYWLIAMSNENNFSAYSSNATSILNNLRQNSVIQIYNGTDYTTESISSNKFGAGVFLGEDNIYYYCIYFIITINYPISSSHVSYLGDAGYQQQDPTLYAFGANETLNHKYIYDIYNRSNKAGYSTTQLYSWSSGNSVEYSYFSDNAVDAFIHTPVYLPNGNFVNVNNPSGETDPEPTAEPTTEPTAEPTAVPTVEPSADSSLSQQQQQQIAEGAIQVTNNSSIESDAVTVNISDGITEETVQRLDQTLQNNNPYQTTFTTAVQTIDGFRQIGVKFAQTSEAFLAFLPSWVTDLLALMFVLLFFFIVLRLLKVFHG